MESKQKENVKLSDYLSILLNWKKMLIINLILVSLITIGITFLIPEKFKSTATLMIQESQSSGLFGGMIQDLGGVFSKAFGGGGTSEDKLFGFLGSNQLAEKIISKFKLDDYYEFKKYKREKTLKAFKDDFQYDLDDNGFIEISMIHKNPQISAEIVNYAIEELNNMNLKYAVAFAKKYREFVEKRYLKNLDDLQAAQDSLEKFQKKYGIYAIPEQLEVAFKAYAELEKEISVKELQKDLIKETYGTDNAYYQNIENQLNLLNKKIKDLMRGKSEKSKKLVFLDIKRLPLMQKKFLEIKRDLEIQTKLLEFTLPMYEQAVMEEQKTLPAITVIDEAVPPEIKYSPKRAFIVLSIFFLALFFHIPFVFRAHYILSNPPENDFEKIEFKIFDLIRRIYKIKTV